MTRICLDSNVLVAAFAARGLCADILRLVLSEHELVVPQVVAEEVRRVLVTKLEVTASAIEAVEVVLGRCEVVAAGDHPCPVRLRDRDDERVLAGALAGGAEILVTGDQDLLVAAAESPIRILSPRGFFALARGGPR